MAAQSAAVATACAAQTARYRDKGVALRNACENSAIVQVDADRMQQVLGNLLDNAGNRFALLIQRGSSRIFLPIRMG